MKGFEMFDMNDDGRIFEEKLKRLVKLLLKNDNLLFNYFGLNDII
jgi:Ca2+-binding EF-hand superfamily protein